MPVLKIHLDGDGLWPDLADKEVILRLFMAAATAFRAKYGEE